MSYTTYRNLKEIIWIVYAHLETRGIHSGSVSEGEGEGEEKGM